MSTYAGSLLVKPESLLIGQTFTSNVSAHCTDLQIKILQKAASLESLHIGQQILTTDWSSQGASLLIEFRKNKDGCAVQLQLPACLV